MGSKSFASCFFEEFCQGDFTSNLAEKENVEQKLSNFYKKAHTKKGKNGGGWIDQRCEEDYAKMQQLENEALQKNKLISQLSQEVFGKKNYLKGLGPAIKLSKSKSDGASKKRVRGELDELNSKVETLTKTSKDYQEKLVAQQAMIDEYAQKYENLSTRHQTFVKILLDGGSAIDLGLNG